MSQQREGDTNWGDPLPEGVTQADIDRLAAAFARLFADAWKRHCAELAQAEEPKAA